VWRAACRAIQAWPGSANGQVDAGIEVLDVGMRARMDMNHAGVVLLGDGWKAGLVLLAVLLVLALAVRMVVFRLRRVRKAGGHLEQQEVLAQLAQQMRQRLVGVASNDLEWVAVQMAMERLLPLLQLESLTLLIFRPGYDPLRFTEPAAQTSRLAVLVDANIATLRTLVQRQVPLTRLELTTSAHSQPALYAAVPLNMGSGGIGMALLERGNGQVFTHESLALASQFGHLVLEQATQARASQAAAIAEGARDD